MTQVEPAPGSLLGSVGFSPAHERVYRWLVHSGGAYSARDVACALTLSPRVVVGLLRDLEAKSLVNAVATRPVTYTASPPELALEPLLVRRVEELAQVRLLARQLQGAFARASSMRGGGDLVDVVGPEQVMRSYQQLVDSAGVAIESLTRPPYAPDGADRALDAEGAAIDRGVHARSVYDRDALAESDTLAIVERGLALGEEARAGAAVPMKLLLVDRRIGIVPLVAEHPEQGALVVHASPLLDALGALFDGVWASATPLFPVRSGGDADGLDVRSRQALLLMSAGLKDESIARAMGVSRRTVQKFVTTAMTTLGARTRFQAALLAYDRGWLGPDSARPGA